MGPNRPRIPRGLPGWGGVGVCLLMLLSLAGCENYEEQMLRVSGQIESDAVTAGSRTGGRVVQVLVREGDYVEADALLLQLDDDEAQAMLAAAQAKLDQAEASLAKLRSGATAEQIAQAQAALRGSDEQLRLAERGARPEEIRAAQAATDAARAQWEAAQADFERMSRLYEREVVPRRDWEQAQAAYESAEAQHQAAREQQAIVAQGAREEEIAIARAARDRSQAMLDEVLRGAREEDIAAAEALRDAARADRDRAMVALRETQITAPIGGYVESLDLKSGDLMRPGPAVRLVDPEDLELRIYVSAAMLGHLQLGQILEMTSDAHGEQRFSGEIIQIATEGEFTPRNLQTQEERVQQVFAVTLKLDSADGRLRPGMTATVHLERN